VATIEPLGADEDAGAPNTRRTRWRRLAYAGFGLFWVGVILLLASYLGFRP
jgi:hypothetical protein